MENNENRINLPKVSIIFPAYNSEKNISNLITSLLQQDYPKNLMEIVVIDNNSTDRTREMVKRFSVKLLEEKKIQSSYAARNKGIENAKNEILAFIDSDCIATKEWLKEGVRPIIEDKADLVGGKVEFYFSKGKTASELYDSITNMQIKDNIKERNVAKTANLFTKKEIFNKIGLFPNYVKSGGDVQWTNKATRKGFSLVYAPKAIIMHPARSLKDLLKKQYRVGKGMMHILIQEGRSKLKILFAIFRLLLPPRLFSIKKMISQRGITEMNEKIIKMWWVSYLCNISTAMGILTSFFMVLKKGTRYEIK